MVTEGAAILMNRLELIIHFRVIKLFIYVRYLACVLYYHDYMLF